MRNGWAGLQALQQGGAVAPGCGRARAMTRRRQLAVLLAAALAAVPAAQAAEARVRVVDLGPFTIELPADWRVQRGASTAAVQGELSGNGIVLAYDYSREGWSRGLPQTVRAYLDDPNAAWVPACPFCDAAGQPARDYRVDFAPIVDRRAWPQGDYLATMTRPDGQTLEVPVHVPPAIRHTTVTWTEDAQRRTGRAEARVVGQGVNGLYLKNKASGATLSLITDSLVDDVWRIRLNRVFESVKVKGW